MTAERCESSCPASEKKNRLFNTNLFDSRPAAGLWGLIKKRASPPIATSVNEMERTLCVYPESENIIAKTLRNSLNP